VIAIFNLWEAEMADRPVGVVGAAISEAREKQEWEAIKVISEHISDYLLKGGPDLETEDVELGRGAGVTDLEVIALRWKVARKKVKDAAKLKVVEQKVVDEPAGSLKKA
jgi:hypothetical protein